MSETEIEVLPLKSKIAKMALANHQEIVDIRRYLHAHPELSFKEKNTAEYITRCLDKIGVQYKSGIGGYGITGTIKGKDPDSLVVALRADFDALPITELNNIEYRSQNDGVMHACGHDAHTASLLGTLRILNQLKNEFSGTVKFIFQPAEEKFPGGAKLMIEDGVLEDPRPDMIIGQHVYPDLEAGQFGFRPGKYMAAADEIYITFVGEGGHAAMPNKTIDPLLITAHFLTAVQQLVSRNADPFNETVVSFGKIIGEGATNVIPDFVKLEGTIRTMNEEWRDEIHDKLRRLANGIAASMGGMCELEINKGYPYLKNDPRVTKKLFDAAKEYIGNDAVHELPMRMGAEDFAYYSHEIPACFYRFGTANAAEGIISGLHTPTFNIEETSLKDSVGMMTWLTIKLLSKD
ncbi:MAG: amidohydrolase [Chitinophagales bacterium]|nr:amidohydrolase [Chitinophagales bacterium]